MTDLVVFALKYWVTHYSNSWTKYFMIMKCMIFCHTWKDDSSVFMNILKMDVHPVGYLECVVDLWLAFS